MPWSHGQVLWNVLATRDVERTKKFYAEAMGWTFDAVPIPDGAYWIAKANGAPVGGIFDISGPEYKDAPESWMPYIGVDDVDARVKKAIEAGGQVAKPAWDVPGVARLVVLREPAAPLSVG
jgi:predicted enzyme related to lactoylglutathione lyase